jgi:hypothetical protein
LSLHLKQQQCLVFKSNVLLLDKSILARKWEQCCFWLTTSNDL